MDKRYISVFALNKYIKARMNQDVSLQNVYIKGEISNYRPHPSGHLYFTLKDENSRINAIMFASHAKCLDFKIESGMQVFIQGSVSVYEVSGQYQLYVQKMQQDGIGNLYLQFEKLKKKLQNEGLFDASFKKKIPSFPSRIAVLSAKQGAAVQDVVRTIQLRFPFVKVIVFPIPVQGKGAFKEIVSVLQKVDTLGFDTIILARGGGSIEDLWNFNEEDLARCIFHLQTPLITGVGHETDFTICDFVSDYRAVTPTAAAIVATPDQKELNKQLTTYKQHLAMLMNHQLQVEKQRLLRLKKSYCLTNPDYLYANECLRLNRFQDQLVSQFQIFNIKWEQKLQGHQLRLKQSMDFMIHDHINQFQSQIIQLDALSPLKIMQRGYTLVQKDEQVIKEASSLNKDDDIVIVFHDGKKNAKIK